MEYETSLCTKWYFGLESKRRRTPPRRMGGNDGCGGVPHLRLQCAAIFAKFYRVEGASLPVRRLQSWSGTHFIFGVSTHRHTHPSI